MSLEENQFLNYFLWQKIISFNIQFYFDGKPFPFFILIFLKGIFWDRTNSFGQKMYLFDRKLFRCAEKWYDIISLLSIDGQDIHASSIHQTFIDIKNIEFQFQKKY